jgi:hypothetical protein
MTAPASPLNLQKVTALQKEWQLFKELFARLRDALLNRLFDLRPEKAVRRRQYLVFLFILTGFLVSLREYPLDGWAKHIQDIFSFLFIQSGTYAPNYPGNPFDNISWFGYRALTDPHTVQYLPLLLASFFIALQSAAIYLADIFELEDVSVARKFVSEVALTGSDETIRITQGDVFEEHRNSSNYLIGGPGKVMVDIDSVALFEKPDGTTRIIGPTGKESGGKATLDGFERFRQAIDLRDHYIELRDQNDKVKSVKSRSRDGIPVVATDVRFMFSVHRGGQKPNDNNPYPFSKEAIERLVYKATSRVTPDLTNPSTFEFSWINNMVNLIRGKLSGFMNEHKLTEYLASIGQPELEKAEKVEKEIAEKAKALASSIAEEPVRETSAPSPDDKKRDEFVSRYSVKKNLFDLFTEEFLKTTRERGVELHWIGVGTWKTPVEVVPEKHLEAWKLSRENLVKGSDGAIRKLTDETMIQETITLIQEVPVEAYQAAKEEQAEHKRAMQAILKAYQQQLIKARDFINAKAEITSEDVSNLEVIKSAMTNISKAFEAHII